MRAGGKFLGQNGGSGICDQIERRVSRQIGKGKYREPFHCPLWCAGARGPDQGRDRHKEEAFQRTLGSDSMIFWNSGSFCSPANSGSLMNFLRSLKPSSSDLRI